MSYSVVIPVYNEQEVLRHSYEELKRVMDATEENYELIFVDDGSRDGSLRILRELAESDDKVKALSFSRNFGHQAAVTCGMRNASGDAVIIIDCDLQDPPRVILEMIEQWKQGYQIVYGKRKKRRGESLFKKATAFFYYRIMNAYSDYPMQLDAGDFRLLDRSALEAINAMPEHNRFLRGMNAWAGFRQTAVEYEREPRFAGKTKYTMKKMLKLASDGIVGNSSKPLFTALKFGIFLMLISVLALLSLAVLAIVNATGAGAVPFDAAYWVLAAAGFLTSCILISNGVTNAYIGRIYDEVKNRPVYIVSETINFNENREDK